MSLPTSDILLEFLQLLLYSCICTICDAVHDSTFFAVNSESLNRSSIIFETVQCINIFTFADDGG